MVQAQVPDVRFAIASFKPQQARDGPRSGSPRRGCRSRSSCADARADSSWPIAAWRCRARCRWSCSINNKPTAILYWIRRAAVLHPIDIPPGEVHYASEPAGGEGSAFAVARRATTVRPPSAERVLFPEFLTCEDKSREIAAHVIRWLLDESHREGLVAELAKLKARIGHSGARAPRPKPSCRNWIAAARPRRSRISCRG